MSAMSGPEDAKIAEDRRLDRRTFLRSAIAGGTAVLAGGMLETASAGAAGASTRTSWLPAAVRRRRGGNLRVGLTGGGSTDSLNPFLGGLTAIGTARAQQLYQPLVQLANNAQVQYVLAEEIVPKGSTSNWIIRLRPGVTFHNGKPFGADDVIYFLQTVVNPKMGLTGGLVLTPVDIKGLRKIDNLTVEVPMTVPFGSFPEQLAALWWVMYIPPAGWKQGDKPIGTGPFVLESFTPGQQSVFVRNKNYWKPGLPFLDSVTILDFADPTALLNAITSNVIDATGFLTGTQLRVLQNTPGIKTVVSPTGAIQPFTMRVDKPPFNDVNVRQAFRYLINRQELIETTLDGYGWVGADVTSPYDPDYDHSLHRDQDLGLARHLLKKAGYDNNLTVTLDTSLAIQASAPPMAAIFKQQASTVGVTVNINQVSASDFFGPNYYTVVPFAQIYYDYSPYLSQVAQTFLPSSPWKETHFSSPQYTQLYFEANKTQSASLRRELTYEMQKIDFTQGGYIVPCFVDSIDAYSTKLTGYVHGEVGEAMGNFNFEDYSFVS
jgi:peptide/nickel transport system substrate-binding protein